MVHVGGTETERVLERLQQVRPSLMGWERVEASGIILAAGHPRTSAVPD